MMKNDNNPISASKYGSLLELSFEKLGAQRVFSSADLQRSADKNVLDSYREQYRVQLEGRDVGFMTFDIFHEDHLNLYEIIVDEPHRGRGIGTQMLKFAVELARKKGKKSLSVLPGRIREQTTDELMMYYTSRGFFPSARQAGLLEQKV